MSTPYDFIGIGLGPFNLGLACLTEPIDELNGVFLESATDLEWHGGMLLEHATLQTPFLADLVTLADPASPYSFLNYLKQSGRLYSFYIRESFYPLRSEYNDYLRWAAAQLDTVRFAHTVTAVEYDETDTVYVVHAFQQHTRRWVDYRARHVVVGTGTTAYVPEPCRGIGQDVVHSSDYLHRKESLQANRSITVVGSGQSAAEIFHDLLSDIDRHGYELNWLTRSPRFYPLEYTKLTLEMTSPDYTDHFHRLPTGERDRLLRSQTGLYKGIDSSLIDSIFDLLYTKSRSRPQPARLLTNTSLLDARYDEDNQHYTLTLAQHEEHAEFELNTAALVLATGYHYETPGFLSPIKDRIGWDNSGRFAVGRNYSIDRLGREVFVQNAEIHTHGFVAPDLGMGPYRNSYIIRELLGREYYPIENSIAFQQFGPPTDRLHSAEDSIV